MSVSELELDLGTATMSCTSDEIATAVASLLHEMRIVARRLRPDERVALRLIMAHDSGTLRVKDVFRDFSRESAAHMTLRRLRAAQFVRPAERGHWEPEERIEVKPFAQLLWDRVGEATIFAPDPDEVVLAPDEEVPQAEAAQAPAPVDEEPVLELAGEEEVVDLAAEEPAEEPAKPAAEKSGKLVATDPGDLEQVAASIWEDEEPAVDLADVDDFRHYVEEELRENK